MSTIDTEVIGPQLDDVFQRFRVELAYLFGSQATGMAGPLSDVDIAVLLAPDVPREDWGGTQVALITELIGLFRRNDVDVVILNRASPLLADRAIRYGRVLCEPDPLRRTRFEVKALQRYLDTKPLRKLRRTFLQKRFQQSVSEKEVA
jgi:predicted nucleotidyltransferase